jgi:hypothetical protein
MSTINTNGLNVNYPVPGVNNNSQGFRDNFNTIKTNLDVAGTEITDLQTNVVLKSALQNSVLNNDMANTLISNAAVRSFRHTTYNLGNSLSGTVLVDVSLGDVQIGTVSGNVTFTFGSWAPTGTQSNVQLQLSVSNVNAVISFPEQVIQSNSNYGTTLLENYANVANVPTVTVPYGVTQLDYNLSSVDCGDTITIEPYNRPQQTTQIVQRTPPPTGFQGDVEGTVAVDDNYIYVCTASYDATTVPDIQYPERAVTAIYAGNLINCTTTTSLVVNSPIIFSGTTWGNIDAGTTYYIKTIPDGSNITISATGFDGTAGNTFAVTAGTANTMTYRSYNGSTIWKRIDLAGPYGNDIVTGNLAVTYSATVGNLITAGRITSTIATGTAPFVVTSTTQVANLSVATAGSATTAGTVTTAAQPNITSVGTLSNITISGNANVSGNLNISTSGVRMTGGTNGFFLQTDGAGNLSWTNGTVVAPSSGAGGANTQIQFNDAGAPNGASGFTFNKSTSLVSLPAALTVVGNITVPNVIGNLVGVHSNGNSNINIPSANGNVTISSAGNANIVIVTGTGANITGTLNSSGNANVGNLGTAGLIVATGNVTGGNLVTAGALSVTGNANVGNLGTAGLIVVTGNITGGNIISTGAILSNGTAGIGYTTGAGSTVTQASSRTTGVTINAVTGSITLVSAAGSSAYNTFTVTNNKVAATDVIIINQKSGTDKYEVFITNVSAGSFAVTFADINGTTVEQPVFSFAVIKGITA